MDIENFRDFQTQVQPFNTALLFPRIGLNSVSNYSTTKENSIEKQLDNLFPEQKHEDKTIKRTKELLGNLANKFSDDEAQTIATEIEYLCETWLDTYERTIFKGKTLNELLNIV